MNTFKRVLRYSKPYWWRIGISMIATLGVAGTDGAIAYLVEPLIKKIFAEKDLTIFLLLPVAVIIVFVFRGICRYTYEYFISTAGQLAMKDVRTDLYNSTMFLSLRYYNNTTTGGLMSRVLSDVAVMQEGVGSIVTGMLREGVTALGLLGVVFYRNWQLAIISLLVIPLTAIPAQNIGKRIKRLSIRIQERIAVIAGILQESYAGIKVIKAFGLEKREIGRFSTQNDDYYRVVRKTIKYSAMSTPIIEVITSLGIAAVIWYGGSQVMHGTMTAAEFFSFITAMVMLYTPVKKLLGTYNTIQRSVGSAERVFEILDEKSEIVDPADPVPLGEVTGQVDFCDVSFRYNDEYVLQNINLHADKGEVIALVGPSGAGKTTLASLLMRFYDVTDGVILINGIDIRTVSVRDLMEHIALVDQETTLFNDTIANNIRYGKSDASQDEVLAAARAAFAHDFISEMPEGYETMIGDRGVRLSGGQRQRVCIARAILKNAPILVLDEATSALDTESEQMVQNALNNLMASRTTFVIAHRLSTILHADKIIVLERGEIVESGNHAELLAKGGLYKRLYDMQFQE